MLVRREAAGLSPQRQRFPRCRGGRPIGDMAGPMGDTREPAAFAGVGVGGLRVAPIEALEGEVLGSQVGRQDEVNLARGLVWCNAGETGC